MKSSSSQSFAPLGAGMVSILIGAACNRWVLASVFSPDGVLSAGVQAALWAFDLFMVGLGVSLIRFRRRIRPSPVMAGLLMIAPLLLALAAGETWARVWPPSRSPFERRFPVGVTRKPLPYTMFGGSPYGDLGGQERLNGRGYRGQEPSPVKGPQEYRIFMLGGSTVFEGDPPIPALLEAEFHRNGWDGVKVFNYGAISAGAGQELARLVWEVSDLSPDLVILYDGANDILHPYTFDPRPGYPFNFVAYESNPLLQRDVNKYPFAAVVAYGSGLCRYCFPGYFVDRFVPLRQIRMEVGYGSEPWKEQIAGAYVAHVVKASRICGAFGSGFVGFFQPTLYTKNPLSKEEEPLQNAAAKAHCLEMRTRVLSAMQTAKQGPNANVEWIDLSDAYRGVPESVFVDPVHTRQESKGLIAGIIYKYVELKIPSRVSGPGR